MQSHKFLLLLCCGMLAALCLTARPGHTSTSGTWLTLSPGSGPSARYGHAAVLDSKRNRMIVFGGKNNSSLFNDVWALDLASCTPSWTLLSADSDSTSTRPRPRRRADVSAVYDRRFDRFIVSCGEISGGHIADTWAFYLQTNKWVLMRNSTGLCPREGSYAVMAPGAADVFLFGGFGIWDNGDYYNFSLADSTWSLLEPSGCKYADCGPKPCTNYDQHLQPDPRWYHKMVWDPVNDRAVLMGGYYSSTSVIYGDTWSYNGSWSTLNDAPGPKQNHSFVYDSRRGRAISFAGGDDGYHTLGSNDVWALSLPNGGTPSWTTLSPAGSTPPEIQFQAAVYDSVNDRMVVFGGVHGASPDPNPTTDTIYSSVWELAFADTKPAAITDLDGAGWNNGEAFIGLSWTVPSDTIDICSYLYAVSADSITEANFESHASSEVVAHTYSGEWPPGYGHGSSQTAVISSSSNGTWYVAMKTVDANGLKSDMSNEIQANDDYVGARSPGRVTDGPGASTAPKLWPAAPNPARTEQAFVLDLPASEHVPISFAITSLSGRRVRSLLMQAAVTGRMTIQWDLRDDGGTRVPPGMYFAVVRAGGHKFRQTVLVLR